MTLKFTSFIFKSIKNSNYIFLFFFLIFIGLYILNFQDYNTTFATDFRVRYKPYGQEIVNQILNLDYSSNFLLYGGVNHHAFFNSYFIPELITGILLYVTPNEYIFSVSSNFLNMILMFFSIKFFFDTLSLKNKNQVVIIFFIFFFLYLANWVWAFWKLADIYFLFIFSLIFYFTFNSIQKKKISYLIFSFLMICISFITKPQALAVIPFFFFSLIILYYGRFNFFKALAFISIIYFLIFPIFIFFLIKNDQNNFLYYFYRDGHINGIITYNYNDFLNQFSLSKNNITEVSYYYFLIIKKTIYQITFLRESYSDKHNIFLILYFLIFYFFIILNFNFLLKNYTTFCKLTLTIVIFTIFLQSSLGMSAEPNRTILFVLIPLYILFSISFQKSLVLFIKGIKIKK